MKLKILKRTWNLLFVDESLLPEDEYANCDLPASDTRNIQVNDQLRGKLLLDTLIHESQHAGGWNLNEEYIESISTDIAEMLWKPQVLRRVLDDPLVKKIVLELIHEDLAAKDKKPTTRKGRNVREAAEEGNDQ